MKNKLSKDTMLFALEYAKSFSLSTDQLKTNHVNCPAGEDTRRRLSIKVTDDRRMLVAHCFNCACSGAIRIPSWMARVCVYTPPVDKAEHDTKQRIWVDAVRTYEAASPHIHLEVWPMQYFDDCMEQLKAYDMFGMRLFWDNVFIPCGEFPDETTKFIVRNTSKKEYLNILRPDIKAESNLLVYNPTNSKTGVVCEDAISGMKIAIAGYAGIVIGGLSLSTHDALLISMLYDNVIVWLDNDSTTAKAAAIENSGKMALYTNRITRVRDLNDPKKYTVEKIKGTVDSSCYLLNGVYGEVTT